MSEEEIKALALQLGLDPKKLVLFEPFIMPSINEKTYRFEYRTDQKLYDYNFIITRQDVIDEQTAVKTKLYVNKGLREIADRVQQDRAL